MLFMESIKIKIIIGDPDPSVKITKLSQEIFASEWTGTAIFIEPKTDYQIHKEKKTWFNRLCSKIFQPY